MIEIEKEKCHVYDEKKPHTGNLIEKKMCQRKPILRNLCTSVSY